jgi:CubicO group peptidase (beta-lactamase class C family)
MLALVDALVFLLILCAVALQAEMNQSREKLCSLAEKNGVPGVAIAVFDQASTATFICGTKDAKHKLPVKSDAIFEAASIGKPLFAYAVLKLAEERRLDLDAPLVSYLGTAYVHLQDRPANKIL